MPHERLAAADLLMLGRWNTPTIYNGWERITKQDPARDGFNLEPTRDFMPQMGPMCGYAVTVVCEPSKREHKTNNPNAAVEYLRYIASVPGPKIVVVQDLDKPVAYGSFWGEVNSSAHKALGCVGAITDGAVRDVDEMVRVGFKCLARCFCVGHAHSTPVRWNCPVTVFGRTVDPGRLIHADQHGFLVIPPEDEACLLDAATFMDANECRTTIPAARDSAGCSADEILARLEAARTEFNTTAKERFVSASMTNVTMFKNDDAGYRAWIAQNIDGYVINCERNPRAAYLVLHRAGCETLKQLQPQATTWTAGQYIKVCATDRAELAKWAQVHTGGILQPCGHCNP